MLLEEAGLELVELRPGIDGMALIQHEYAGGGELGTLLDSSPLNREIDAWGAATGRRPAVVNARKLLYCGNIVFHARRG